MKHLTLIYFATLVLILLVALPSQGQVIPVAEPSGSSSIAVANPVGKPPIQNALPANAPVVEVFDGFKLRNNVLSFYSRPPFTGTVTGYTVGVAKPRKIPPHYGGGGGDQGELLSGVVTPKVVNLQIRIKTADKQIRIDNFQTEEECLPELDKLIQAGACNLPFDIWKLRYSRLFD